MGVILGKGRSRSIGHEWEIEWNKHFQRQNFELGGDAASLANVLGLLCLLSGATIGYTVQAQSLRLPLLYSSAYTFACFALLSSCISLTANSRSLLAVTRTIARQNWLPEHACKRG